MNNQRNKAMLILLLAIIMLMTACGGLPSQGVIDSSSMNGSNSPDSSLRSIASSSGIEPVIPGMEPMLENDHLRLYMNESNAEIAVLVKQNGQIWYSNPLNREEDKLATPYLKGKLSSQLSLVYLTYNGQTKNYDSYNDSVLHDKQFEIQRTDQEVTVVYTFGNPEKGIEVTPEKLSKERFEELLSRLSDEKDQEELTRRYRFFSDREVYERRDIPKSALQRFIQLFEKMDYTEEQLIADNEMHGAANNVVFNNPRFVVPLTYTLDKEHFIARVDTSAIEETRPDRVHSISLLENFGAAGIEDEGYIFLPDGSGAIMYLNNGKKQAQPIQLRIYGEDHSIYLSEKFNSIIPARLPVFGIKRNEDAFLAIIENGDGIARLTADISGRNTEYNTLSSFFTILPRDEVRLSDNEIMHKTPEKSYAGKIQLRYSFMRGEQANYSGMAAVYRQYLEQEQGLKKLQADGDLPFYLELVGGVPKMKNFLGFPYESMTTLSNFAQTKSLIEALNKQQINNIQLKYQGWFNNGLLHDFPSKVRIDSHLGKSKEWQEIADLLKQGGGQLYPDVAFLQVYSSSNGFNPRQDAAQFISRMYAQIHHYDLAAFFRDRGKFSYYLIAPQKLSASVNRFLDKYEKWNPGAISLRDLGTQLHSDFAKSREMVREDTKHIILQQLAKLQEATPSIMADGGNAFVLPYVSHLLNTPQSSNDYQLSSESVPFYQMVLHGYIDYAGKAFNLADEQDVRVNILKSLETGSNVYYSWIYENPSVLKSTSFNYLNSHYYAQWMDEAIEAYNEVNNILKQVRGQHIVHHERLAEGVFQTQFEGGMKIIVNYNNKAVKVNALTIQARDYYVEG